MASRARSTGILYIGEKSWSIVSDGVAYGLSRFSLVSLTETGPKRTGLLAFGFSCYGCLTIEELVRINRDLV